MFGDCDGPAADICGDFDVPTPPEPEAPVVLPPGWSIDVRGGSTVSISTEQANSGDSSIKIISAGGGYNRGFITMDLTQVPSLQKEMYGRAMVYISDENSNRGDFTFLQAEGNKPQAASGAPAGTDILYRSSIDQRFDHVISKYDTWIDEDADDQSDWQTDCVKQPQIRENRPPSAAYLFPKNQWVCVQWHIRQSSNHIGISLNGTLLSAITVYGSGTSCVNEITQGGIWYAPETFDKISLGVEQYADDAKPRTLYIDDIMLDTQLVSCDGELLDPSESDH